MIRIRVQDGIALFAAGNYFSAQEVEGVDDYDGYCRLRSKTKTHAAFVCQDDLLLTAPLTPPLRMVLSCAIANKKIDLLCVS